MNKFQLTKEVRKTLKCSIKESKFIVDSVLDCMKAGLTKDKSLILRGWIGNFIVKLKKANPHSRNPKTGEIVATPAKNTVRYIPSITYRNSLNK